eukprot:XP_003725111.1 PREDICTED: uncharacterized protein LOC100893649 isoform X1 [Strongylocentrotus purpuratus]
MIESKSKLCALLIGISKLLSRENVQQLVFVTMELIENRQLSEKCEETGNALPLFQAMRDRDLYTHTDPSLLLQHLKTIDRQDAVRMLEQEMGVPSQKNHSADQVPGAMWSPGTAACHAQLNVDFKDGASNLDTDMAPFNQGCTGGTKEPEASLQGDATSPSNFPDIPDRHHPGSKGDIKSFRLQGSERELTAVTSAGNCPAVPERPVRDGNKGRIGSLATVSSSAGSVTPQTAALASSRNHPVMPELFPREGNGDTKGSSEHGLSSPARPDRTHATVTYIPARPPRGGYENLPIQESRKIFTPAVLPQTARPDETHTIHVQQHYPVGLHRPLGLGQGIDMMYQPSFEVEQPRGRPPPLPERPPRRPEITELELCQLSRHFNAGVIELFGLELGYSSQRISQLMYDSPHDVSKVFYRLMVEWRSAQHGDSNMRENLANHLRNIQCMELAHDLEGGRFR